MAKAEFYRGIGLGAGVAIGFIAVGLIVAAVLPTVAGGGCSQGVYRSGVY